jgi:hypothetical protein
MPKKPNYKQEKKRREEAQKKRHAEREQELARKKGATPDPERP